MKCCNSLVVLMLFCLPAVSNELAIIELQHRLPEQVIPSLKPLLSEGGTMVGANSQLFIKTTPNNLEEIRQALAVLDRPLHRLLISVTRQDEATKNNADYGIRSMALRQQGNSTNIVVAGSAENSGMQSGNRQLQQVQAIDGSPALIFVGQQTPYSSRVTTSTGEIIQTQGYQNSGTGFTVTARLLGDDRVTLEIEPQHSENLDNGNMAVSTVRTEVSGRLGQWIEIGNSSKQIHRQSNETLGRARASGVQASSIVLKVDRLD